MHHNLRTVIVATLRIFFLTGLFYAGNDQIDLRRNPSISADFPILIPSYREGDIVTTAVCSPFLSNSCTPLTDTRRWRRAVCVGMYQGEYNRDKSRVFHHRAYPARHPHSVVAR